MHDNNKMKIDPLTKERKWIDLRFPVTINFGQKFSRQVYLINTNNFYKNRTLSFLLVYCLFHQ